MKERKDEAGKDEASSGWADEEAIPFGNMTMPGMSNIMKC